MTQVTKNQIAQEREAYRDNPNVKQGLLRNSYFDAAEGLQGMVEALEFANDARLERVAKLIKEAQAAIDSTEMGQWI